MKVLDSLIRVAKFRLEQAEQKRSFLISRISRLRQSKQIVEADLRDLQQRYAQSMQDDGGALAAHRIIGMRQIWVETQERQKLTVSMDEQLKALLTEKDALDTIISHTWGRKKSLERALEIEALLWRDQMVRNDLILADESWSQMQASRAREQRI